MALRSAVAVALLIVATLASWSSALEPPPFTGLARLRMDILASSSSSSQNDDSPQTLSQSLSSVQGEARDVSFIEIALKNTDNSAVAAPHGKSHPRMAFKRGKHAPAHAIHPSVHKQRFAGDTATTTSSSSTTTTTSGTKNTVKEEEPKPPKVIWVGGTKRVGPWPFTADGAIPWGPLIMVIGIVLITIILCCIAFKLEWITLDKIAKSIDACCYFFVLICWGIKWIVTYVPRYTWYPCKECCHSCVECWNSYFYPYKNTT